MFTIRKIVHHDLPQLFTLFKEFAQFENLPEKMTNSLDQMDDEKDYIHGFVAVDTDNLIIGYVSLFFAYYTWSGKCIYMDDLYVTKQWRGKGVGSHLVNTVIAFAKDEKCKKLRWQVSDWNKRAIEFYQSLGATIDPVETNCELIL